MGPSPQPCGFNICSVFAPGKWNDDLGYQRVKICTLLVSRQKQKHPQLNQFSRARDQVVELSTLTFSRLFRNPRPSSLLL